MVLITYETPDGVRETQITDADLSYDQTKHHWEVKTGEKNGRDVYALIPRERVYEIRRVGKRSGSRVTRTANKS